MLYWIISVRVNLRLNSIFTCICKHIKTTTIRYLTGRLYTTDLLISKARHKVIHIHDNILYRKNKNTMKKMNRTIKYTHFIFFFYFYYQDFISSYLDSTDYLFKWVWYFPLVTVKDVYAHSFFFTIQYYINSMRHGLTMISNIMQKYIQ